MLHQADAMQDACRTRLTAELRAFSHRQQQIAVGPARPAAPAVGSKAEFVGSSAEPSAQNPRVVIR